MKMDRKSAGSGNRKGTCREGMRDKPVGKARCEGEHRPGNTSEFVVNECALDILCSTRDIRHSHKAAQAR